MFRYPDIPRKEKQIEVHPYQKLIKEKYIPRLRYYHNSVKNPKHPEKKERLPNENRTTFSVFGDIKSKEFLYCVNIVEGLHKYRWKLFDTPIIKGATSIEWPQMLRDLKLKYGPEVYCIDSPTVVLMNGKLLGGQKHLKAIIKSNYHYYLNLDYPTLSKQKFIDRIKETGRSCAFMHIDIENVFTGTLIFELFDDKLPRTCENFKRLCRETRGGYSGTPVHRIVTDGWIQCGGYGLKSVPMDCENFIVNHDRRGLLCMANAERHIDCSTQFFVLLQPAPWMDKKYVAFGQLIDGEQTLKDIEAVPTWYESPLLKVIISKAGILNLEAQDLEIYKGTKEYIEAHIENLSDLEDYLLEWLMRNMWLALEYKEVVLTHHGRPGEEPVHSEEETPEESADGLSKIHTTKRFIYNKSRARSPSKVKDSGVAQEMFAAPESRGSENKEFDVEEYFSYEEEQSPYTHVSVLAESLPEKPYRPYYIALTDVHYADEKGSTYDLKKFLDGEYCLESDVVTTSHKVMLPEKISYISEVMTLSSEEPDETSSDERKSIDSCEEKEVQDYLKGNVDRFCFAGGVIKKIAKGVAMTNFFAGDDGRSAKSAGSPKGTPGSPKSGFASPSPSAISTKSEKRVSMFAPPQAQWREDHPSSYRRRPTGIRPQDFDKIKTAAVRNAPSDSGSLLTTMKKLQEGLSKSQREPPKEGPAGPTALSKLFEKALCDYDGDAPKLKDHMPKAVLLPEKTLKIFERGRDMPPSLLGETNSMRSINKRKLTPERRHRSISFTSTAMSFPKTMKPMSVAQYQELNKTRLMEKAIITEAAKEV